MLMYDISWDLAHNFEANAASKSIQIQSLWIYIDVDTTFFSTPCAYWVSQMLWHMIALP